MQQDFAFGVTVTDDGEDHAIVSLHGELDIATAPQVESALAELIREGRRPTVDLSGVAFIDSSGLAALIRTSSHLSSGGPLVVRDPRTQARRLFEIAGVSSFFEIEPNSPA